MTRSCPGHYRFVSRDDALLVLEQFDDHKAGTKESEFAWRKKSFPKQTLAPQQRGEKNVGIDDNAGALFCG